MRFYKQRIIDKGRGDCYRACLACILDKDPTEIPNFTEMKAKDKDFHDHIQDYLATIGMAALLVHNDGSLGFTESSDHSFKGIQLFNLTGALCIASIASQRFPGGSHAVVAQVKTIKTGKGHTRNFVDIIHDPNPLNPPYPWHCRINTLTFLVAKVQRQKFYPCIRQKYPCAHKKAKS